MSIALGVSGASGRMGRAIIRLVFASTDFKLVRAFEYETHPSSGKPLCSVLGLPEIPQTQLLDADREVNFKGLDVLIEFTNPEATMQHVRMAAKNAVAIVIGTTGLSDAQKRGLKEASGRIAILAAPNMSIGANLIFTLSQMASKSLGFEYDAEVIEAHHKHKKDAPSGTAIRLAESIARGRQWDLKKSAVYGRHGDQEKRGSEEIGIHAVRAGDIVGEHTALFSGPGETVEITHRATTRDTFARGALMAAKFLKNKKRGLFEMSDVLKQGLQR